MKIATKQVQLSALLIKLYNSEHLNNKEYKMYNALLQEARKIENARK